MTQPVSDALVFFGATGDLAYKQIFPSLQRLAKRDKLKGPVIGVAKSGWTLDDLKDRARKSLETHGGIDPEGFNGTARGSISLSEIPGCTRAWALFSAPSRPRTAAENASTLVADRALIIKSESASAKTFFTR